MDQKEINRIIEEEEKHRQEQDERKKFQKESELIGDKENVQDADEKQVLADTSTIKGLDENDKKELGQEIVPTENTDGE